MEQFLNDPVGLSAIGLVAFLFLASLGLRIDRSFRQQQRSKGAVNTAESGGSGS